MLRLSRDPAAMVRRRLAENPKLSRAFVQRLADDPDRAVAAAAAARLRALERPEVPSPRAKEEQPRLLQRIIDRILASSGQRPTRPPGREP
jgi:hypothetical protein